MMAVIRHHTTHRRGAAYRGLPLSGLVLALLLAGCSAQSDIADLEGYVAQVKSGAPRALDPVPEFKTYETYTYTTQEMRDPFRPVTDDVRTAEAPGSGLRPDTQRNREALEQFPLDTLNFVGHLERSGRAWAIVTSPDGLVHRVQEGNYLGQNFGKIDEISETRVELIEIVPDGSGGWIERQAALSLNQE